MMLTSSNILSMSMRRTSHSKNNLNMVRSWTSLTAYARCQKQINAKKVQSTYINVRNFANPMFQDPRRPELHELQREIDERNRKEGKTEEDTSFLARYGGKIATFALAVAAGLLYGFFKGVSNKDKAEETIMNETPIEPYEMQELRYAYSKGGMRLTEENRTNVATIYNNLILECKENAIPSNDGDDSQHPSMSYGDFLSIYMKYVPHLSRNLNEQCKSTSKNTDKVVTAAIPSGHLIDRLIMSLQAKQSNNERTNVMEAKLPLPLLVMSMTLTLNLPVEDRLYLLYNIGKSFPPHTSSSVRSQNDSNGAQQDNSVNNTEPMSYAEISQLLNWCILTCQIPTEKRVTQYELDRSDTSLQGIVTSILRTVQLWFVHEYRERTSDEFVRWTIKKEKKQLRCEEPIQEQMYSYENVRMMLLSNSMCIWGECYGHENDN